MLECAVVLAAVVTALVLMSGYVGQAFDANTKRVQEELTRVVKENRP